MMQLFKARLQAAAAQAEEALASLLPQENGGYADRLTQAMRYSALGGGKRLRAYLVLEFCALCGGDAEAALPYAAGIEMIHAFSLIHDDLPAMDNDVLRRGKPTNHVLYGESTALLAGDALSLYGCETVACNKHTSDRQNLAAVRVLSARAGVNGMCGGQQIDLQSEQKSISCEELEALVDGKTGALFSAACELGCIAADASDEQRKAADRFGREIGLAFQIADDLLDRTANAQTLGKTPGKDAQSGKSTFLTLLGTDGATALANERLSCARECLNIFPETEAKRSLLAFCDFVMQRTY